MNEETLIWLFGILGLWCLKLTIMVYYMMWQMKKIRLAVELFVNENGKGAVTVLHSPDDHLGMDALLDSYKLHHHDLSYAEWVKLKEMCERVKESEDATRLEKMAAKDIIASIMGYIALNRSMAKFLVELAKHKTTGFEPTKQP